MRHGAKEEMLLSRKAACDHPQLLLELPPLPPPPSPPPPHTTVSWTHPNANPGSEHL